MYIISTHALKSVFEICLDNSFSALALSSGRIAAENLILSAASKAELASDTTFKLRLKQGGTVV